jgi:hypothetical protein
LVPDSKDGYSDADEITDENVDYYRSFETTVDVIFRRMAIDFRNSSASLSLEELSPLCIGTKYRPSEGTIEAIESKPIYVQCLTEFAERICMCPKRGSEESSLPLHRITFQGIFLQGLRGS